jgi:thymidylate kinase
LARRSRRRIAARAPDHFEREQAPFFERVRRAYLERAQRDPKRVKVIDAAGAAVVKVDAFPFTRFGAIGETFHRNRLR